MRYESSSVVGTREIDKRALSTVDGLDLLLDLSDQPDQANWIVDNAAQLRKLLKTKGALLIRGLPLQGMRTLERNLMEIFSNDLLNYNFGTSPRKKLRGRIYTSTEYDSTQSILLHNESSYSNSWPMNIAFYCVKPADGGGATPIADSRRIYQDMPEWIRDEFENRQLMYMRHFGDIDLPWPEVFQTADRNAVEHYCRQNRLEFEWLPDNGLRTRQINRAVCLHPETGEKVWFNQAHLFHPSALEQSVRAVLSSVMSEEDLPKNVYYGDGGVIDKKVFETINEVYNKNAVVFTWKEGDLLLLDNMLFSHGREPYTGSRKVLVGMANAMDSSNAALSRREVV